MIRRVKLATLKQIETVRSETRMGRQLTQQARGPRFYWAQIPDVR